MKKSKFTEEQIAYPRLHATLHRRSPKPAAQPGLSTRALLESAPVSYFTAQPFGFDVALSFPGERRDRVENIANALAMKLGQEAVFYDRWYSGELAAPNMDLRLAQLYGEQSRGQEG